MIIPSYDHYHYHYSFNVIDDVLSREKASFLQPFASFVWRLHYGNQLRRTPSVLLLRSSLESPGILTLSLSVLGRCEVIGAYSVACRKQQVPNKGLWDLEGNARIGKRISFIRSFVHQTRIPRTSISTPSRLSLSVFASHFFLSDLFG